MRLPFLLSSAAKRDLDEIIEYVLQHSGVQRAEHVVDRLYKAFRSLSRNPRMGHTRTDLTQEAVLFWPVWSYLIVYRPGPKPIRIARCFTALEIFPDLLKTCRQALSGDPSLAPQ